LLDQLQHQTLASFSCTVVETGDGRRSGDNDKVVVHQRST
jgi:hypothetical protein